MPISPLQIAREGGGFNLRQRAQHVFEEADRVQEFKAVCDVSWVGQNRYQCTVFLPFHPWCFLQRKGGFNSQTLYEYGAGQPVS